ncbi:hypothetical protein E8E11_011582 [Didymella keratinophila]|nr:hypothetical protein E8E11_011582 [Didymella keratinophila]
MEHLEFAALGNTFKVHNRGNVYSTSNPHFWTFPETMGWKVDTTSGEVTKILGEPPKLDFNSLMQSWLFFGLIAAVVYDDNRIPDRRFIASRFIVGYHISTAGLPVVLDAWQKWEERQKKENDPTQRIRLIRAQLALDLAQRVVHKHCTIEEDEWKGVPVQGETYVEDNLALSLMVIGETLSNAKIPLLKFLENPDMENDFTLEVTDSSEEPEYATLSHVWSDGYGNPNVNELYRYQLDYIHRLLKEAQANRVRNRSGVPPNQTVPFWMDTLLIPVGKDQTHKAARKKAIHKIYDVFADAKYTVVIDNGLNKMDWDPNDYTTTAMKILASGWMRRLWTLQEAFLSRRIMFAFKNSNNRLPLVDLGEIEELYDDADEGLKSNLPETTAHLEHETLALDTLLNLEMKQETSFATTELLPKNVDQIKQRDAMMRDFWTLLVDSSPKAIPAGIIFLAGDRIAIPGFGWVPRTWMSANGADCPNLIAMDTKPAKLLANNEGLEVAYPGFFLHYQDRVTIMPRTDGRGFWFPSDSSLTEVYHVKKADDKTYTDQRGIISQNQELAIILCRPRPGPRYEVGLLVKIVRTKHEKPLGHGNIRKVFVAHILYRVKIRRKANADEIAKVKHALQNYDPSRKCLTKWYVGCRTGDSEEQSRPTVQQPPPVSQMNAAPITSPLIVGTEIEAHDADDQATSYAATEVGEEDHLEPMAVSRKFTQSLYETLSQAGRSSTKDLSRQNGFSVHERVRRSTTFENNTEQWAELGNKVKGFLKFS